MHIVLVNREYPPARRLGGIGSYQFECASALVKAGHRVTVVCASDNTHMTDHSNNDSIEVIRLKGGDFCLEEVERCGIKKYLRLFTRYRSYRKEILRVVSRLENVDIVEFADYGNEAMCFKSATLTFPWVVRLHGPMLFDRKTLQRKKLRFSSKSLYEYVTGLQEYVTIKKADGISSCSYYMTDWFLKDAKTDKPVKLIHNFIDLEKWKCNEHNDSIVKSDKTFNIFFAGTIVEEKGVVELIEACKNLYREGIALTLTLAGKIGSFGEALQAKTEKEQCDYICFIGHIQQDRLKQYYCESDLVCFPSWWESFGLVCIEAMAVGALVVGSNVGGMAEVIDEGVDGFLVAPKNVQMLESQIKKVMQMSEPEKDSIRSNAICKVSEQFSSDVAAAKMIDFYRHVIQDWRNQ